MARIYVARRMPSGGAGVVSVRDAAHPDHGAHLLPPRNDVCNHSPDGFQWGYGGSGPAQLALALCIDALSDGADPTSDIIDRATNVYQIVKANLVARMKGDSWTLDSHDVLVTLYAAEDEIAKRRRAVRP